MQQDTFHSRSSVSPLPRKPYFFLPLGVRSLPLRIDSEAGSIAKGDRGVELMNLAKQP
jgi:hypothetical protein